MIAIAVPDLVMQSAGTLSVTRERPGTLQEIQYPQTILVASIGDAASASAVRVASAVATARGSTVRVLSVIDSAPDTSFALGDAVGGSITAYHTRLRDQVLRRVKAQLADYGRAGWPTEIAMGQPADVIPRRASQRHVDLVIMGLNHHTSLDRALGRETAGRVLRSTAVPVLAVTARLHEQPHCVIVGIDFSRESFSAARSAVALAAPGARILLTHVQPMQSAERDTRAMHFDTLFTRGIGDALHRFADDITADHDGDVEYRLLTGDAATELINLADMEGADLFAMGARRGPLFSWFGRGSVRAKLAQDSRRSILVAPAPPAAATS